MNVCSLIVYILIIAVILIVTYFTNRGLFWLMLIGLSALTVMCICFYKQEKQNAKAANTIERTKILSKTSELYNERTGKFTGQTTFMLYFYNGTQKTVTVENGSKMYDEYMYKLKK